MVVVLPLCGGVVCVLAKNEGGEKGSTSNTNPSHGSVVYLGA